MNKYEELKNKIDEEIKSIKEHELKLNELKEEIDKAEQEENSSNKMPFEKGEDYYYTFTAGAQFYKVSTRNVKNDLTGQWEKVPYYAIEDQFPYGHGEKSVFLIERKMHLKIDEAMAIRWHMGEFGDKNSNAISQAYDRYPLAVKLHLADLESTFLREKGTSAVNK